MTLDTSTGSNTPSARSGPRRPLSRRSFTWRAADWAEEPAGLLPEGLPDGGARRRRLLSLWPLLVVLAVQAGLSLRLLWADTASQSEALYLRAGHLEWANWLHGTPIPPFPKYFSGAPVVYAPIGAVADSIGGLAGARVLSLAFMLGATILLWSTTGRLFGRRASFFASALFALMGTTLHLGGVRHLRRDVGVPGRAGGLVRDPAGSAGTGDRVDARRGGRARAGQCRGVHHPAVRPAHRRARACSPRRGPAGACSPLAGPGPSWSGRLRCWAWSWRLTGAITSAGSSGRW